MIVLAVKVRAKAEKIEEVGAILKAMVPKANAEPGCEMYELFYGAKDPQLFYFFEKWTDQASLDLHNTQLYLKAFRDRREELLEVPNEVTFLTPSH